jgi:7-keto-8-aminopelargonate synthetase-like enzyme
MLTSPPVNIGPDGYLNFRYRPTGPKSKLASGKTVTNLASYNYYNLVTNESLKEKAIETLRTYGVGPCGPPGFYGTQDVHKRTEAEIAAHIGTPNSIVYAQAFSTISSVIPAFSKRGDIIVADESVNFPIQKGIQISRSTVYWYKHNDLTDMERVLAQVVKAQAKKPLTRRFIITEGLFEDVGDMVDLPKIVRHCLSPSSSVPLICPRSNLSYATNSVLSSTRRGHMAC